VPRHRALEKGLHGCARGRQYFPLYEHNKGADERPARASSVDLAIKKSNWLAWKQVSKPLTGVTPTGIFSGYPDAKAGGFNPEKARQLLAEAGYRVTQNGDGSYSCPSFPVDQVEYSYPTISSNKVLGEYLQAQWKQSLGITVPLRSMESKTFFGARAAMDYKGLAFGGWSADYMDPFTFLNLFYTRRTIIARVGGTRSTSTPR
jgi:oligopeptide transport system substrate-binding protein